MVDLALTTRWNARRHTDGSAMLEEILSLGFRRVELGYDTRIDLTPGVRRMVRAGAIRVDSVHNFCPVPPGAARPHPELYTFVHPDRSIRDKAVAHTTRTLEFAAELGARVVVSHCGSVAMRPRSRDLIRLAEQGRRDSPRYHRTLLALRRRRDGKSPRPLQWLADALERLMPVLSSTGVNLALENMPTWEAFPTEHEMERLLDQFGPGGLRYWHDIGHGQIRENLGLVNVDRWLERLDGGVGGMHVHDVAPPGRDHLMPPQGGVDFRRFARFARRDIPRVLEPAPGAPPEQIAEARAWLEALWDPAETRKDPGIPTSKENTIH